MLLWYKQKNMIFLGRENNINLWNQIITAKSARQKKNLNQRNAMVFFRIHYLKKQYIVMNGFSFPSSVYFDRYFVLSTLPIDSLKIRISVFLCSFSLLCSQGIYLIFSACSFLETEVGDRIFCKFNKTTLQITLYKFGT